MCWFLIVIVSNILFLRISEFFVNPCAHDVLMIGECGEWELL